MLIINQCAEGNSAYVVSLGEEHQSEFKIFANSCAEAVEFLADYLFAKNDSDSYFDALEVSIMAGCKGVTMQDFADAYDLYHCPKYHIYLPDVCVQEVIM